MAAQSGKEKDIVYEILEERISFLESLKSFHNEVIKMIRQHTTDAAHTPAQLLQNVVNLIQSKFDLYLAAILTVDRIKNELTLTASACKDAAVPQYLAQFRLKLGEGISGHVAQTGETIVANDITQDPRYIKAPGLKSKSELCVAVNVKNEIVGVLNIENDKANSFRKDFTQAIEDIAFNIGFIIENKKLYDDMKDHSLSLEKKVNDKVTELKDSERRYRNLLENASDPIMTIQRNGNITWANNALCSLLGIKQTEVETCNITQFVQKGYLHLIYISIKEIVEGKDHKLIEVPLMTNLKESKTVEISCSAIKEKDAVVCIECIMRDITEKVVVDKLKKDYTKTLEDAVEERTKLIKDTQRAAILAIANLAESIDTDTGGHLERIRSFSKVLAEELRKLSKYRTIITDEYVELLFDLSPLHDLGKVGIRDSILLKPAKLTSEEFTAMQEHAEIGARALKIAGEMIHRESVFSIGEMIARYHHEKWDGSGYPAVKINDEMRPLRGEEIPLCARIVALADVYDALTSKRPYKEAFPHEKAKQMIVEGSGKHFDPEAVQAFLKSEKEFIRIREHYADVKLETEKPFVAFKRTA